MLSTVIVAARVLHALSTAARASNTGAAVGKGWRTLAPTAPSHAVRYVVCSRTTAQPMRAILFASATVALCVPRVALSRVAQRLILKRAPTNSRVPEVCDLIREWIDARSCRIEGS